MPDGQTQFAGAWLSSMDTTGQKISEWSNIAKDDYHGYCQFCNSDITIDNAGKAQLLQHTSKRNIRKQSNIVKTQHKPNCAFLQVKQTKL